jgi:hypothetical protein
MRGAQKDVPDARRVFKAILEAIVVVVSWRSLANSEYARR